VNTHLVVLLVYASGLMSLGLGLGRYVSGATALGYGLGVAAWWWVGSAAIGSFLLAWWVGPAMRRIAAAHDLRTVGDYLEHRFDSRVRATVTALLWFGSLFILASQLIAIGWILNVVTGRPALAYLALLVPAILGIIAQARFPDLANADLALPTILMRGLPTAVGALGLAAVFSAEVSAALAIGLAITSASVIDTLTIFYALLGVSLFVPILAGLYSPRTSAAGALAAIGAGVGAMLAITTATAGAGFGLLTPSLGGLLAATTAWLISLPFARQKV